MVSRGAGIGRRHLEKEIIWSVEERKNRKEKYLEKENIWSAEAMEKEESIYFFIVKNSTLVRCVTEGEMLSRRRKEGLINSIMGATSEINN